MSNHIASITAVIKSPNTGNWQGRHADAIMNPGTHEAGIVNLLRGWLQYADRHSIRYESGIGEDFVLGDDWKNIGQSLLGLLNGELGRLDGGSMDSLIRNTLKAEGFNDL